MYSFSGSMTAASMPAYSDRSSSSLVKND